MHYRTGEKIPADLVQKIVDAKNFQAAYLHIRQVSFGLSDMAWHTVTAPVEGGVAEFERRAIGKAQLLPYVAGQCMATAFGHIFSGGYAAGYYGYKWAEVLDAGSDQGMGPGGANGTASGTAAGAMFGDAVVQSSSVQSGPDEQWLFEVVSEQGVLVRNNGADKSQVFRKEYL